MKAKTKTTCFSVLLVGLLILAAGAYPVALRAADLPGVVPIIIEPLPDEHYEWTIEKSADQNEITLSPGQQLLVSYTVIADANLIVSTPVSLAEVIIPTPDVNDECADIYDTGVDPDFLGTVCADETPKTFTYTRMIGPYAECGVYEVNNTAYFVTQDTQTTGSDDWTIAVTIPCEGCTLTPGYWKTHSKYGPAPYDDAWAMVDPDGEDTMFFDTGKSWYEVLWTNPKKGNAYYILAHAYIAAALNVMNDADIPADVLDAWNDATTLLDDYDTNMNSLKGKNSAEIRADFIAIAKLLDDYNNGITGPGHCTE
ncbi:MAG: hypothetical protein ACYTBJ_06280 [Planctomycetota bacterium]|jgi:hypothetical protein